VKFSMRSHATLIALLVACGLCGNARADDSLHAIVTVTTGFTDNVLGASEENPDLEVEADGFMILSPGVVYAEERRRYAQVATYRFGASMFVRHSEANSYQNEATWAGIYVLSPQSEIGSEAAFTYGQINAFRATTPAQRSELGIEPASGDTFATFSAQEGYTLRFGRDWRLSQGAGFRIFQNLENDLGTDANYYTSGNLGLRKSYRDTALAGYVRGSYIVNSGRFVVGNMELDSQRQVTVGPEARFSHDLTETVSTELGVGALFVAPPDFDNSLLLPTWVAALRYGTERGNADLSYRRAVQPNLFVGETTLNDVVALRGGLPLDRSEKVGIAGALAYTRGQIIDVASDEIFGSIDLFIADAAVGWQLEDEIELSGRAQYVRQVRDEMVPGTLENVSRTQLIIAVTGRYPSRQATEVSLRESIRVDEQDRFRVGEGRIGGDGAGADRR
jgi:hypothetical protein